MKECVRGGNKKQECFKCSKIVSKQAKCKNANAHNDNKTSKQTARMLVMKEIRKQQGMCQKGSKCGRVGSKQQDFTIFAANKARRQTRKQIVRMCKTKKGTKQSGQLQRDMQLKDS